METESERMRMLPHQVSTASQTAGLSFDDEDYHDLFLTKLPRHSLSWWGENIVVSVFNVVVLLSTAISLTLCVNSVTSVGGDEYAVLLVCTSFAAVLSLLLTGLFKLLQLPGYNVVFSRENWRWIVAVGVFNFVAFSLFAYSSDVSKTPPQLQIILFGLEVPLTVLARKLILKQGVSGRRLTCVFVVIGGILVCIVPQLISRPSSSGPVQHKNTHHIHPNQPARVETTVDHTDNEETHNHAFWILLYSTGHVAVALMTISMEKLLSFRERPNIVVINLYVALVTLLCCVLFFWTDFIPSVGRAGSAREFTSHLSAASACLWSDGGGCAAVTGRLWAAALATSLVVLTQLLVITSSDGAVFLSMLAVLTIPLGTIFWTLWKDTLTGSLIWSPDITVPSVFALIGMAVLLPAMMMYEYLGMNEKYEPVEFQELD